MLFLGSFLLVITVIIVIINLVPNDSNKYATFDKIATELESEGLSIETNDKIASSPEVEIINLTINQSEKIMVYIYESNLKMEKYAEYVLADGSTYDNGKIMINIQWVSFPHYYKMGNIIALYVGNNTEIINSLEQVIGTPFAGY
jgi:hypothetical protein